MHSPSTTGLASRSPAPPSRTIRQAVRSGLRLAEVRLRIPIVLLVSALVVGRWDVIRNYWDKLTHVFLRQGSAASPVSNDTEYFCPMDPGVVSSWPGKCGSATWTWSAASVCSRRAARRSRGPHADHSLPRPACGNPDGAPEL